MSWGARYCRTDSAARCDRASLIFYTLADYFESSRPAIALQQEAAQALAHMARDAIGEHPNGPSGPMAIELRDAGGPMLQVKFQFPIDRH